MIRPRRQRANPIDLSPFPPAEPTYPIFVAAVWSLVKEPARFAALAGAQVGLSIGTCGLLMALTVPVFGRRAAKMAGLLYAFSPSYVAFCALIYTETLQMFLVALAALAAMRLSSRGKLVDALAFGTLWGILGLNRPESTYVLPFLVLPFVVSRQTPAPRKLAALAMMLAACATVMAPWVA